MKKNVQNVQNDNERSSILISIKKLLGIAADYIQFDSDIILHINSTFSSLKQLGVGPEEGFQITSENETWNDYIGEDNNEQQMVVSFVYLKVRLLFDPPGSSILVQAINDQIKELEWRLSITEK